MRSDSIRCGARRRSRALRTRFVVGCLGLAMFGCIPSNVVAHEDRAILSDVTKLDWAAEHVDTLDGLFESVELQGAAAAQLWKIYYLFEPARYTAAALTDGDDGLLFQSLAGTWHIDTSGQLVLDEGDPVRLQRSRDGAHLRIEAESGTLVLRHVELR